MPDDMKFDEFLRRAAKDYNAPVPPPADAIWSRIEQDVAAAISPTPVRVLPRRRTWLVVGAGIAATLMIGVAVGRWTALAPAAHVAAIAVPRIAQDDSARSAAHAQNVTLAHLADAEVFITTVRADLKAGRADADRAARSRELLARTRLLLGASANRSPAIDQLLQDLELLLAEISALPASRSSMDVRLLDETMRDGNILPRIRATLPAPSAGT